METGKDRVDGGSGIIVRINLKTGVEEERMHIEDFAEKEMATGKIAVLVSGVSEYGFSDEVLIKGNSIIGYSLGLDMENNPVAIYKKIWGLDYWFDRYKRQVKLWEEKYKDGVDISALFLLLDSMFNFQDDLIEAYKKERRGNG